VVYPPADVEWSVVSAGLTTLPIALAVLRDASPVDEPTPQCVVGPRIIESWSVETGLRRSHLAPPAGRFRLGGPTRRPTSLLGPAASHYEYSSPLQSYLVVWLFDVRMPREDWEV